MNKIYDGFQNQTVGEKSLTRIMMQTVQAAVEKAGADFGEEAFPYKYLSIRPAKKDCLPAITAFLKASAISKGFLAFAIAVLTSTPSHPSSIAIVASDA